MESDLTKVYYAYVPCVAAGHLIDTVGSTNADNETSYWTFSGASIKQLKDTIIGNCSNHTGIKRGVVVAYVVVGEFDESGNFTRILPEKIRGEE